YGAPGVEFMGLHEENNTVVQIHFIPDQCQLVTLLDDNSLHLWSLKQHSGASELREEHRFMLKGPPGSPPSATQITAVLPHSSREVLYLGTESGNIFVVELPSFRVLEDRSITSEAVLQRVPEDSCNRRSCELVEALREHPKNPEQILIGYSRGLIVLWDLQNNKVTHHFLGSQQLENLYWQRDGSKFISCHYDGSYTQWPVSSDNRQPEPLENIVPYGQLAGSPPSIPGFSPLLSHHLLTPCLQHPAETVGEDYQCWEQAERSLLKYVGLGDMLNQPLCILLPRLVPSTLTVMILDLGSRRSTCQNLSSSSQVLVMELNDEDAEHVVDHAEADLLQDQEGYRWKGHEKLKTRDGPVRFEAGFQPFVLVQCQPPAVVTSLALHSEWKLVAFGTSHGFGLFDHQQKRLVFVKCTLHPSDQLALEGPLSRVKSLKKSLRQSFRRIRRSRVSSRKRRGGGGNATEVREANAKFDQDTLQEMELAPVQRKIEARSAEDSFTGFVRTLYFADTFLRDSSRHCPSLWAGTNGGTVYAFSLHVPPAERRMDEPVRAEQAKEIQLMHRAPVVSILVLDGRSTPLPEPLEVAHDLSKSPDMQGSHQLLVISEEQFKVFTLPKVSSKMKLKLTALEGCRVRKATVANFGSCKTDDYCENDLAVLTNLGDIQIISLPFLKLQTRYPCIRKEDVSGIASCVFTKYGQGFYLISPSEFERFSLSTKWLVEPRCIVD
ncbi:Lethal(2) giant larvae protein 2, partial [Colius striatus]